MDYIVYLRCSPEVCFDRLNHRNRVEETDKVTLDYLRELHEQHENWLREHPRKIVIDGDREF